jgi:Flp pilus assembly protein protease CpaA
MVSEIFANENLFLIVLGLVWIVGAILQDFKRREVDNLWNFSLIAIALSYRGFVSIFQGNYGFILNGLMGLGIFFILGNLFYYSRLFAGGDAKLLFALGAVLPLSYELIVNLKIFGLFIFLFFALGAVYSLIYSFVLVLRNWKEFTQEILIQWIMYKKMFWIGFVFVLIWTVLVFIISQVGLVLIGLVILLFPLLFIYAKAVEESCFKKSVDPKKITEGEWLYADIKVKGKKIMANWDGISKKNLDLVRKYKKKILIKIGVPFTPSFLLGFITLLWLIWRYGLF